MEYLARVVCVHLLVARLIQLDRSVVRAFTGHSIWTTVLLLAIGAFMEATTHLYPKVPSLSSCLLLPQSSTGPIFA